MSQKVPEDGVYVNYSYDSGKHVHSIHRTALSAARACNSYELIGFVRWGGNEIEDLELDE